MNKHLYTFFYSLFIFTASCATPMHKVFNKKKMITSGITADIIIKDTLQLSYSELHACQSIDIQYLGCGGFYFKSGEEVILVDPFFSQYPLLTIPFKKIGPIPTDIAYGLRKIEQLEQTKAVVISHSHYDHLFDTPYIFENYLKEKTKIYGSLSAHNILQSVIDTTCLVNIDSKIVNHSDTVHDNNWIKIGNAFRVLPIASDHAPHFRFIIPVAFYKNTAKPIEGYDEPTDKTRAGKWKEGKTFSYLIDIMEGEKCVFRIFLQSSAADPTHGFPPDHILASKQVDMAMLGAASFQYTKHKQYPWELIDYLTPKRILICHWEDFFRPYQEEPKHFLRMTNFKKFLFKLNQQYPLSKVIEHRYFLPEPGCMVKIMSE